MLNHTLLSAERNIHDTSTTLNAPSTGLKIATDQPWSVSMQRLRGGVSDGVDVVTINNGRMKLDLLPTRGMGVWRGDVDGVPLHWVSPVSNPVHPSWVDPMRRGGIGWLDGFNELICRCGLGWHGAPANEVRRDAAGKIVSEEFLPLHGRIANLPAHDVQVSISEENGGLISVTGVVDEGCLFGGRLRLTSTLRTQPGSSRFTVEDVVTNLGSAPAESEMLYHCNIGRPFLGDGATFHSASTEVAPRNARAVEGLSMWNIYQGPTPGYTEQVYFSKPVHDERGYGVGVLCDPDCERAFVVRFDTSTLPWFTLWKCTQADQDGYVTGLEPGSSFPNPRAFERTNGRVIQLAPGASVTFRLEFETVLGRDSVRKLLDEVTAMQVAVARTIHPAPLPTWCAP
ncbi:MAG: aldose 1-epimerase family protein [Planctomyces sp.]|nr:aldose 1-epimerase family protein [Planctomyces sp.]